MMDFNNILWMIYGLCAGTILTTIVLIFARMADYYRNAQLTKELIYSRYDWEDIIYFNQFDKVPIGEIVLPESYILRGNWYA